MFCLHGLEDLAAAYSPVPWGTVPWALGIFTAEFGMGSGAGSPPWPPGRPARPDRNVGPGWQALVRGGVCLSETDFRAWRVRIAGGDFAPA